MNDGVDKTMAYRDESQRRATKKTSRKESSILSESSLRHSRTKKWMNDQETDVDDTTSVKIITDTDLLFVN